VKEKSLQAFDQSPLDVLKLQFLEVKKTKGEEKSISLCLGRDTQRDLGERPCSAINLICKCLPPRCCKKRRDPLFLMRFPAHFYLNTSPAPI
jgi:hypothetical protein